jgi:hypothetical protein
VKWNGRGKEKSVYFVCYAMLIVVSRCVVMLSFGAMLVIHDRCLFAGIAC